MKWDGWKFIGRVGVDSGQLMIVDPSYIDSQWERDQEFRDIRRYRDKTGVIFQFGRDFSSYEDVVDVHTRTPNQLINDGSWEEIPYKPTGRFGYDTVSHATIENAHAEFNYCMGHPGVAVAFRSGYGDGYYPVYAKINDEGRVVQVAIEMDEVEDG